MEFKTKASISGIYSFVVNNDNKGKYTMNFYNSDVQANDLFPVINSLQMERFYRGYELVYTVKNNTVDTTQTKVFFDTVVENIDIRAIGIATVNVQSIMSKHQTAYDISMVVVDTSFLGGALTQVMFKLYDYTGGVQGSLLDSYTHSNQSVTSVSDIRLLVNKTGVKRIMVDFSCRNTAGTLNNYISLRPSNGHYLLSEVATVVYKTIAQYNTTGTPYEISFLCVK